MVIRRSNVIRKDPQKKFIKLLKVTIWLTIISVTDSGLERKKLSLVIRRSNVIRKNPKKKVYKVIIVRTCAGERTRHCGLQPERQAAKSLAKEKRGPGLEYPL